jgi:AraC-like DNA-binding protein
MHATAAECYYTSSILRAHGVVTWGRPLDDPGTDPCPTESRSMARPPLPLVAAGLQDPEKIRRIRQGVGQAERLGWGRLELRIFPNPSRMDHALTGTVPAVALLEPTSWWQDAVPGDGPGRPGPKSSGHRIIAYLDEDAVPAEMVDVLMSLGCSRILVKGRDDHPAALAHVLVREATLGSSLAALDRLEGQVPHWFLELLRRALPLVATGSGDPPASVGLDATTYAQLWMPGASPRSFRRALHRHGLPAPGWLLRWLVALRVVSLHRQGETELWRTAHELGYGSTETLSRRIKRLTGRPPRELSVEDLLELLRDRSDSGERRG